MRRSRQGWPQQSASSCDLDQGGTRERFEAELPKTEMIDVSQALATLTYAEMMALAGMYERWALAEENLTPDQRTQLVIWSADYEMIAAYVGESWRPCDPDPRELMSFVARQELEH